MFYYIFKKKITDFNSHVNREYTEEMKNNKTLKKFVKDAKKIYVVFIEYDENNINAEKDKIFLNVWGSVSLKTEEVWTEQEYKL